jgi:hypothetical protein
MTAIDWVAVVVNFVLRFALLVWEVPRAAIQIDREDQNEVFEIFSAHSARQVVVTWPLLSVVGLFLAADKLGCSLKPMGALVLFVGFIAITALLYAIPRDRYRPRGIPYVVLFATAILDACMTIFISRAILEHACGPIGEHKEPAPHACLTQH